MIARRLRAWAIAGAIAAAFGWAGHEDRTDAERQNPPTTQEASR